MRILLTNNSLTTYTGTESWTYAMAKELNKAHKVTVLSPNLGLMAEHVKQICPVITSYSGEYDFAIVNHTTTWEMLPKELPKIFTSHSKVFDIELPPCEDFVGVNENIGGKIIRNGIDCTRFHETFVNDKLQNILLLSNPLYSGGMQFVSEACKDYRLTVLTEQVFNIEDIIKKADLVISLSRGALESMASGKNVIYGDYRRDWMKEFRAYGMITEDNFDKFKRGEMTKELRPFTIEDLRAELQKYDPKRGSWLRNQIVNDFNIKNTARKYVELYVKKDKCVQY